MKGTEDISLLFLIHPDLDWFNCCRIWSKFGRHVLSDKTLHLQVFMFVVNRESASLPLHSNSEDPKQGQLTVRCTIGDEVGINFAAMSSTHLDLFECTISPHPKYSRPSALLEVANRTAARRAGAELSSLSSSLPLSWSLISETLHWTTWLPEKIKHADVHMIFNQEATTKQSQLLNENEQSLDYQLVDNNQNC